MKIGDLFCQAINVLGCQLVACNQPAEQHLLRELPHLDGELDRSAAALDNGTIDSAGNGNDGKVEIRREAAIEP